ncbi:MAG: VanZ family protein [Flavobacteriaceae bacterium]
MQKRIKLLLERNSYFIALLITAVITYLSLGRPVQFKPPIEINFLDKILHASAYFVLSLSWLFVFRLHSIKKGYIIFVFLFGVLMELLQGWLTENRQSDVFDVLANSFGIIIAILLFEYIYKYYQIYFEK